MRFFLIILLIAHSIVTFFTLKDTGLLGPFPPFKELVTYQVFSDLILSLLIGLIFIHKEVKRKSLSLKLFWICVLSTPLVGSFSPIIYLIWEKRLYKDD